MQPENSSNRRAKMQRASPARHVLQYVNEHLNDQTNQNKNNNGPKSQPRLFNTHGHSSTDIVQMQSTSSTQM
jgi:hypothetical protein